MTEMNDEDLDFEFIEIDEEDDYTPIVLELKSKSKKKKKKKKGAAKWYSAGLKEVQRTERHLVRASHRMAKAVEKGLGSYRKSSLASARKKKDGALRDFVPNSAEAMSKALREASGVPSDLAKAVNSKKAQKLMRRQLKSISRRLRI